MLNELRRLRAERVLESMQDEGWGCTSAENVTDFLANLMHLHGEDWVLARLEMAQIHFADEQNEEED